MDKTRVVYTTQVEKKPGFVLQVHRPLIALESPPQTPFALTSHSASLFLCPSVAIPPNPSRCASLSRSRDIPSTDIPSTPSVHHVVSECPTLYHQKQSTSTHQLIRVPDIHVSAFTQPSSSSFIHQQRNRGIPSPSFQYVAS
jgi:hypothetical protein